MKKILLVTDQYEIQADYLVDELKRRGADFIRFHPWDFPLQTKISVNCSNGDIIGTVDDTNYAFNAGDIKSVWYRGLKETRLFEGFNEDEKRYASAQVRDTLRGLFSITPGLWVNDPFVQTYANLKIRQLQVAKELGLRIPNTIISNDPKEIAAFYDKCDGSMVVFKTLAQVIWKIGGSVFTTPVDKDFIGKHSELIRRAPCVFQEYIEKKLELRITIFGRKILTAAIYSQEKDTARYDWRMGEDLRHEPFQLPAELEGKLLQLMEKFKITYGAIDMILTPEGDYVFLEVNPQGMFGWLEEKTGVKYYSALADLLVAGKI